MTLPPDVGVHFNGDVGVHLKFWWFSRCRNTFNVLISEYI